MIKKKMICSMDFICGAPLVGVRAHADPRAHRIYLADQPMIYCPTIFGIRQQY